jgi:hypothetical protein
MFKRPLAFALMLSLPALALAQRGGGAGSRVQRGDKQADYTNMLNSTTIKVSNKDIENIDPLKLLVEKRKDLKLTDDQLAKLKDRDDKLRESSKLAFGALDSLRRLSAPAGRTPDDTDRARTMDTRRKFAEMVAGIRAQYDMAFNEALPVLDESQQKTATELVQKQRAEAEDMLRDKLGGPGASSGHQ